MVTVEVRQAGERAQILLGEGIEAMVDLVDEGRSERRHPRSISGATAEALTGAILGQIVHAVETDSLTADAVPQFMYSVVLPYMGSDAAIEELRMPPRTAKFNWSAGLLIDPRRLPCCCVVLAAWAPPAYWVRTKLERLSGTSPPSRNCVLTRARFLRCPGSNQLPGRISSQRGGGESALVSSAQ